jgi:phospholipid-binding lipoprotein MlaA
MGKGSFVKESRILLLASLIWFMTGAPAWSESGGELLRHTFHPGEGVMLAQDSEDSGEIEEEFEDETEMVPDPLESMNRAFFVFNDRLYFWVLKPVARGYSFVVPERVRVSVGNFFTNLAAPIRFANCLFQWKLAGASEEFGSFILNSVAGMGGFFDLAGAAGIKKHDEDLGQSLAATLGIGPGFYINWPFLGPSTLRDTFGAVGDGFLYPVWYLDSSEVSWGARSLEVINSTSLRIGDYESLKRAALDPYVAIKDAYYQNRLKKIEE